MFVEIEAMDTLFFRDGKPFSMGEETWADGIFPPYPSTIYGALRACYFANNIEELKKANEDNDPTNQLKIKNVVFKDSGDFLFPIPLDLVKEKKKGNNSKDIIFSLTLTNFTGDFYSNYPALSNILTAQTKAENIGAALLPKLIFEDYLRGNTDEMSFLPLDSYVKNEPKIGIGRSNETLSCEEGKLYRVDMKRLNDLKLVVEFEGLEMPEAGCLQLGGEGKSARFQKIEGLKVKSPVFAKDDRCFKLILTTPAIFKQGWLPEWINQENFEAITGELKFKLLTAAIGKSVLVGGFDLKAKRPKPAYQAVPAGSVYYFELLKGSMEKILELFYGKNISEIYPEQGFGMCYVGKIEEEKTR